MHYMVVPSAIKTCQTKPRALPQTHNQEAEDSIFEFLLLEHHRSHMDQDAHGRRLENYRDPARSLEKVLLQPGRLYKRANGAGYW